MKEETKLHVQEDEKHLLLDHNYDGIQELNHPLPSWWAFLFYGLIAYAIVHFTYFQFLGGPSLRDDFKKEYAVVVAAQEEFKKQEGEFNPDTYAKFSTPEQIKKGEEVYTNNCVACHMEKGRGDIGPNLTDEYWLWAKGTPETIYPVVFNGVVENGMPNWSEVLSKDEIYQVVAYVQTLHLTHQPQGKALKETKLSKNRFDLDEERLATTDEHGHRVYLHPEDVQGPWKNRRHIVYWFLIGLYLVLPWIYINGKPALLIDIFNREFTFIGFTFYGVDPILFFLIAISSLFFIAFMTSLFGRVWCGWGCPQTVFIQAIFMKIETFFEGTPRERRALEQAPMGLNKFTKKSMKWIVFTIISLHIAHTFIGYFVGPRELFHMTMQNPMNNVGMFIATMIISGIFLLDFGWFREQFCIIACPYGRMQSVMMDDNSLVIAYDAKRGEPRRGTAGIENSGEGDCINCYNCVKVCPTGIDIRRGTQLECIACTNCIDACDEIMIKIKKPTGLIRYGSEIELQGGERKIVTARSIIYIIISLLFITGIFAFLNNSSNLQMIFMRGKETFTQNASEVTNRFTLKINHQGSKTYKLIFKVSDPLLADKIKIVTPVTPLPVEEHEKRVIIFFRFPTHVLVNGVRKINIDIYDNTQNTIVATKEVVLVGPTQ